MATMTALADAVVAAIQGLSWKQNPLDAKRSYDDQDHVLSTEDAENLQIAVLIPENYDEELLETRGSIAKRATIEIVIRKRLGLSDQADASGAVSPDEVDELVDLSEMLADALIAERLDDLPAAAWTEVTHDPLYRRDHLRQHRQFTSVILATYEVSSDL